MSDFLTGEGFRGLSQAFGWPRVNHWLPWLAHFDRPHLAGAAWATCQERAIASYSDLPALRRQQQAAPGALASIVVLALMAITILLIHTYFGYFASGGPSGVGVAVGNAVRRNRVKRQLRPRPGLPTSR